jgi:hypothetical protein
MAMFSEYDDDERAGVQLSVEQEGTAVRVAVQVSDRQLAAYLGPRDVYRLARWLDPHQLEDDKEIRRLAFEKAAARLEVQRHMRRADAMAQLLGPAAQTLAFLKCCVASGERLSDAEAAEVHDLIVAINATGRPSPEPESEG